MPPAPSTGSTMTAAGSPLVERSIISTQRSQHSRPQMAQPNRQRPWNGGGTSTTPGVVGPAPRRTRRLAEERAKAVPVRPW